MVSFDCTVGCTDENKYFSFLKLSFVVEARYWWPMRRKLLMDYLTKLWRCHARQFVIKIIHSYGDIILPFLYSKSITGPAKVHDDGLSSMRFDLLFLLLFVRKMGRIIAKHPQPLSSESVVAIETLFLYNELDVSRIANHVYSSCRFVS